MLSTDAPIPQYFDTDGTPLKSGTLYFGVANQNPETSPITVYWDAAGTQPAAQPIKVKNGFTYRAGNPARVYASTNYSITARNSSGALVLYSPDSKEWAVAEMFAAELIDDTDPANGSGLVGWAQGLNYATRTLGWAINQLEVNARWFGTTDDYVRLQAAIDAVAALTPAGGTVRVPRGVWDMGTVGITMKNRVRVVGDGMPYMGTSSTSATAPTVLSGTGASIVRFGDGSTFGTQGGALENVEVYGGNAATNGVVFHGTAGSNAGGNLLRNVHVNRCTSYGITGVAHSFVNVLENVSASNCLIGVYLQEECNDWTLKDPKVQACTQNIVIGKGSGTSQSGIRLIAPKSEDALAEGILIQNPTRSIDILGLYSEGHAKEGIKNLATSATISIQGGELNGPAGTYSHINLGAGCIFDAEGLSFTGDSKNDIELSGGGNFYGRIGPCRHGSTNVGAKINYTGIGSSSIVEVFDTSATEPHFFVYGSTKSYGTFTPVAKGSSTAGAGTYTTQVGEYTRVQNRVHFSLNLVVTAHTGTGNLRIDLNDIPWTPSSTTGRVYPVTIHAENLTFTGQLCATINPSDKTVYLRQMSTGAASSEVAIDATFTLNISGSFPV